MTISTRPDVSTLDVPMDAWTTPFWSAANEGRLLLPRCGDCRRFRWPPGPFCPKCHSQNVEWMPCGTGRVYSYTCIRAAGAESEPRATVPALVEFPDADGVRIPAAIVDTPLQFIRIGSTLQLAWSQAANAAVPVFLIDDSPTAD